MLMGSPSHGVFYRKLLSIEISGFSVFLLILENDEMFHISQFYF